MAGWQGLGRIWLQQRLFRVRLALDLSKMRLFDRCHWGEVLSALVLSPIGLWNPAEVTLGTAPEDAHCSSSCRRKPSGTVLGLVDASLSPYVPSFLAWHL